MNSRNIPIAIFYCILSVLSIPLLISIIFRIFLFGNNYHRISFLIFGISVFLYTLFNTLSHWITINGTPSKTLKKLSLIFSSMLISALLLCYSFSILTNVPKWIMFGMISLFFMYNELFFSIWTNIPFFLAEIFKDTNYIIYLIFLPLFFSFFATINVLPFFIIATILCFALMITSIIFKYIFAIKEIPNFYTVSKVLALCTLIIQVPILFCMIPR